MKETYSESIERFRIGQYALTPKELAIARLIIKARTNKEICRERRLTRGGVAYHIARIYAKAKVETRSEFIAAWFNGNLPSAIVKQLPQTPYTFAAMAAHPADVLPKGAA